MDMIPEAKAHAAAQTPPWDVTDEFANGWNAARFQMALLAGQGKSKGCVLTGWDPEAELRLSQVTNAQLWTRISQLNQALRDAGAAIPPTGARPGQQVADTRTGAALTGAVGGVVFRGRRLFPLDPNSPWVVQSIDARGEGPTHQAAVEAWYAAHEANHPTSAIGHLQYRPRQEPQHTTWAWHIRADDDVWLLCDGSSYDAQFYPELAKVVGSTEGVIRLLDMTTATPVVEKDVLSANPSRDSLQP